MAEAKGAHEGRSEASVAAFVVNATKSFNHRVAATGLRTNTLRYRSTLTGESGPRIGETFLLNTQLRRNDRETELSMLAYYDEPVIRMLANDGLETVPALDSFALPLPEPLPLRLDQAFARRRSRRVFTGDPIDLRRFAAIVRAAAAITGYGETDLGDSGEHARVLFRSVPSPGGLYPIDLYISAQRITGLPAGLYRYVARRDRLYQVQGPEAVPAVRDAFSFPDELISITAANAIVVLVLRLQKLMRKYGDRGVRYAYVEAGEITQSIHLAVTALGFGSVECAGFYDGEMLDALRLGPATHAIVHTILVGVPPSGS
jgi:SagB-type dehydrogenase family enzyme